MSPGDLETAGRAPRDPEELEAKAAERPSELPASTRMGPVHLTVSDAERSIDYYRRALGLEVLERDGAVSLGAGERTLLVLVDEPGARPSRGYTALHVFKGQLPISRRPGTSASGNSASTGSMARHESASVYELR